MDAQGKPIPPATIRRRIREYQHEPPGRRKLVLALALARLLTGVRERAGRGRPFPGNEDLLSELDAVEQELSGLLTVARDKYDTTRIRAARLMFDAEEVTEWTSRTN